MKKIWLLWWKYSDGSGEEIVRAYEDEKRAKEDFALVEEESGRDWKLTEVPFLGDINTSHDENAVRC